MRRRAIVALGRQDVDPSGLTPSGGRVVVGASSDHLVLDPRGHRDDVGSEIEFDVDYGALLGAMTSPYVDVVVTDVPAKPEGHFG